MFVLDFAHTQNVCVNRALRQLYICYFTPDMYAPVYAHLHSLDTINLILCLCYVMLFSPLLNTHFVPTDHFYGNSTLHKGFLYYSNYT